MRSPRSKKMSKKNERMLIESFDEAFNHARVVMALHTLANVIEAASADEIQKIFDDCAVAPDTAKAYAFLEKALTKKSE